MYMIAHNNTPQETIGPGKTQEQKFRYQGISMGKCIYICTLTRCLCSMFVLENVYM